MPRWRIALVLCLTYLVFAILLNSVGTVILQVIRSYGVSKPEASILEACKDLSIAGVSFLIASFLPRIGFHRAMLVGLALVSAACVAMPLFPGFPTTQGLFIAIGVAFALVKVSTYAIIGLVAEGAKQHASFMNSIEGVFMIGVLFGYWLFSFFMQDSSADPHAWLDIYWLLAAICIFTMLLVLITPLPDAPKPETDRSLHRDFLDMLWLMKRTLVYLFIFSAFLYVLVEQGIGTWLPTFNNQILKLPASMSVQVTSIFAATLAIGRLSAGAIMRRYHWYPVLSVCLLVMAVLVLISMPLASNIASDGAISWLNAPAAAYIFPLIGLFMAPIYPAINSVMLSALPTGQHAAMTGLIVIFSALGGTTGSLITGMVFGHFDGQTAFYFLLVPIAIILAMLRLFNRELTRIGVA